MKIDLNATPHRAVLLGGTERAAERRTGTASETYHRNIGMNSKKGYKRTGKRAETSDTFLWRICHALDEPPRMLAKNVGIPFGELEPLLDPKGGLIDLDRDHIWWEVMSYVSKRLGDLIAIRMELNKQLQSERVRRLKRNERLGR